jgi:hypothetical protein
MPLGNLYTVRSLDVILNAAFRQANAVAPVRRLSGLLMYRLILVQSAEACPIGHYDGSVNPLYPELSTTSVDERHVPSQV